MENKEMKGNEEIENITSILDENCQLLPDGAYKGILDNLMKLYNNMERRIVKIKEIKDENMHIIAKHINKIICNDENVVSLYDEHGINAIKSFSLECYSNVNVTNTGTITFNPFSLYYIHEDNL